MRVADTSALYAALLISDEHHEEALRQLGVGPVLVPAEIWSETIALVQFRHSAAAAREAAKRLRAAPNIEIQPTPDEPWDDIAGLAAKLHGEDLRLSWPDAIVVAWSLARRIPAISFDQALLEACSTDQQ